MSLRRQFGALLVGSIFVLMGTGCAKDTGTTDVKPKSVEEQIADIQARTDLPPQAKEIAIQQVKNQSANVTVRNAAEASSSPPAKK